MILLFLILLLGIIIGLPIFCAMGISVLGYSFSNGVVIESTLQQMVRGLDSMILVSVPAFILAGNIMNGGGVTKRMFDFANSLVKSIPGGLGHANVLCSLIFAGMSGSAIADAGGLGTIEIKAMKDNDYPVGFSCAVTAASTIIGPIIPPSVPAVMFAASASVSVGRIFLSGFAPGVMLAVGMMVIVYVKSKKQGFAQREKFSLKEVLQTFIHAIWALLTPVILLGGIFSGIVGPTEAAAVAVLYALLVSKFIYKELTLRKLYHIILDSLLTSAVVGTLIAVSYGLSYLLTISQLPQNLAAWMANLTQNPYIILMMLNCLFLFMGFFMDPTASILIVTPILLPIIKMIGIDPLHFGMVMILNLMIGMLTPPVGMCLYTVADIGGVTITRLMKELVPFYIVMFAVLFLVTFIPQISLFLPNLIMGLDI